MAGWITAFKTIPWGELIAAAPVAVRGARKLWETVRHQKSAPPAEGSPAARLESLEAQVEELRGELTSASGLLATIAEQNAQLVEVVAILRVRTRVLLAVSALLAVAVLGLLAHALAQ
jgi:hypothetical protein